MHEFKYAIDRKILGNMYQNTRNLSLLIMIFWRLTFLEPSIKQRLKTQISIKVCKMKKIMLWMLGNANNQCHLCEFRQRKEQFAKSGWCT